MASPAPRFSFQDLDQDEEVNTSSDSSPEIPIADLPSSPAAIIPVADATTYGSAGGGSGGLGPLYSDGPIVQCEHCDKPVLATALSDHHLNCEKIRTGGVKEKRDLDTPPQAPDNAAKKRKADGPDPSNEPQSKKKKTAAKPAGAPGGKGSRQKGPLDTSKQCGVWIEKKGAYCTRSITCKVHSMRDKKLVPRPGETEDLIDAYKLLLDPTYVKPPKRETKAERKEKKEKEKREQRERDIAAGLISKDAPLDEDGDKKKRKKNSAKKKKDAAANGDKSGNPTGSGDKSNGTGAAGDDTNGKPNGDGEEGDDFDSEAEADELISVVQRSRGIIRPNLTNSSIPSSSSASAVAATPIVPTPAALTAGLNHYLPFGAPRFLGVPLAIPVGASSFFVSRNEALRCSVDIVRSAIGGGPGIGSGIASSMASASALGASNPGTSKEAVLHAAAAAGWS
ncbi:hypothetical protein DL93DRAFT_2078879 [Clavulina sp. PMI_390]|nr:hypothetical protein DL93DRAFT_2078879 [Clavulina sp. PMI_390]